jgi:hypothetical protein
MPQRLSQPLASLPSLSRVSCVDDGSVEGPRPGTNEKVPSGETLTGWSIDWLVDPQRREVCHSPAGPVTPNMRPAIRLPSKLAARQGACLSSCPVRRPRQSGRCRSAANRATAPVRPRAQRPPRRCDPAIRASSHSRCPTRAVDPSDTQPWRGVMGCR